MDLSGFAPISPEKRVFVLATQWWWKKISSNKDGTKKGLDWLNRSMWPDVWSCPLSRKNMSTESRKINWKKISSNRDGTKKDWTYKIDRSDQTVDHVAFEKNEKKHVSLRDHSSITSSKRWVGVIRKWQFLMIYSTVNHQRGGWVGLKQSKTWWRKTWMVPKGQVISESMFLVFNSSIKPMKKIQTSKLVESKKSNLSC